MSGLMGVSVPTMCLYREGYGKSSPSKVVRCCAKEPA
jgi:hypothetical protein